MEKATIALGGRSLILTAVADSLGTDDRFRIVTTDVQDPGVVGCLEDVSARVLIVDLGVVSVHEALDVVRRCHRLTLIGLDPGGGELVVFSGEQARHFAMGDLLRLIGQSAGAETS